MIADTSMRQICYNNGNNLRGVGVTCGVYRITNTATGDFYIGSSMNIESRWYHHRWDLKRGTHANTHLQRAWERYGADAFAFVVIQEAVVEGLLEVEQAFLDAEQPRYNLSVLANRPTGMRGRKHSDATIARMSLAQRGHPVSEEQRIAIRATLTGRPGRKRPPEEIRKTADARIGLKHTPEAIEKMRQASLGRKQSPESIEKTRQANLGRRMPDTVKEALRLANSARVGTFHHSEETRARMTEAQQRRRATEGHIPGKPPSEETRAKLRAAQQRRRAAEKEQRWA